MRTGLLWWFTRHDDAPSVEELRLLAAEVLTAARRRTLWSGRSVHSQLIEEMGGIGAWEALEADLDKAQEVFKW